jgi:hypothetical protein
MKVCMLSSVHSADDIRIVEKEARSLFTFGHAVTVVARPPPPSVPGDIRFKLIELAASPPARAIELGLVRCTAVCWDCNWEHATELKNLYDCDLSSRTDA